MVQFYLYLLKKRVLKVEKKAGDLIRQRRVRATEEKLEEESDGRTDKVITLLQIVYECMHCMYVCMYVCFVFIMIGCASANGIVD